MDAESFFESVKSELGFSFPRSFRENYAEFIDLLVTNDFKCRSGYANTVSSTDDIRALMRELEALGCPPSIIPFMRDQDPEFPDYYGFDTLVKNEEYPVVVFAVHTVVHDWPDFRAFLEWAKHQQVGPVIARNESSSN